MYLSHYRLNEKPFQISPDPKFLWLGETHNEALAILKYGIYDNRGILLLVGDVGTGKTTLVNGLLNGLDENTVVATILDPGLELLDFYNVLANAFQMNRKYTSKGDFLVHFIHFLHHTHAENKKILLIIDEAQRLSDEMLEEIRLLSNIERQNEKLLNIFLVGQDELIDKLSESRNRALLQRITTSFNINPLKKKEVGDYIKFRLSIAGREEKIFTSSAIREITSFSKCYPRLINVICDRALLTGFVKGKQKIDAAIIKECAKELQLITETLKRKKKAAIKAVAAQDAPKTVRKKNLWGLALSIGIFSLLFIGTGYFYFQGRSDTGLAKQKKGTMAPIKISPDAPLEAEQPSGKKEIQHASDTPRPVDEKPEGSPDESRPVVEEKKSLPPFPDQKVIIHFPMNSNEISDETYHILNQRVESVSHYPGTVIVIRGYTDSQGSVSYNRQLSLFRANVVKNYFVGQGISPASIQTIGMGPEDPMASNDTREGRNLNRRVEIEFIQRN